MCAMFYGRIHSIESFAAADGPGVRSIVFLSGCNLRCRYCHNPDTWAKDEFQLMSSDEILAKVERFRSYWGENGGLTVSGGEPLLQPDFLVELFEKARARGVDTCLDTAGEPFSRDPSWLSRFDRLMAATNLVLLDVKHVDSAAHERLTGRPNANILDCARYLSDAGTPVWIRYVLVPGVNSDDETVSRTADFLRTLKNVRRVEVLPYHTLGVFKWRKLGIPYGLEGVKPPSPELTARVREALSAAVAGGVPPERK